MYGGLTLDDCPVKLALHTILDEFSFTELHSCSFMDKRANQFKTILSP